MFEVTMEINHMFVQWKDAIKDSECLKIEMIMLEDTLILNLTNAVFVKCFTTENTY